MSVSNSTANCPHCGMVHQTTCPRIKSMSFYENGVTIKSIEFHAPPVAPPVVLTYQPAPLPGYWQGRYPVAGSGGAIVYDSYEDYVFDGEPKS